MPVTLRRLLWLAGALLLALLAWQLVHRESTRPALFGFAGFIMMRLGAEMAPLLLGMVLGPLAATIAGGVQGAEHLLRLRE